MKRHWAYRTFIVVAVVATILCLRFSVASFLTGAMDMYAYNRDLLDSATAEQRDSVFQHALSLAMRVGSPLLITSVLWCLAFLITAARFRRAQEDMDAPNTASHGTALPRRP